MTQEFVTLRRDVVEQALEALNASTPHNNDMGEDWPSHIAARRALRAALEQPQDHIPDDRNMVPAGWKLAPVEPTIHMCICGDNARANIDDGTRTPAIYRSMLDAAPQPPAVERPNVDPCKDGSCDCCWTDKPQPQGEQEFESTTWSTVDGSRCLHCQEPLSKHIGQQCCPTKRQQPQGDQEPVSGVVIDGSMGVPALVKLGSEDAHIQKFGGQRLYTRPQPRQPLTV